MTCEQRHLFAMATLVEVGSLNLRDSVKLFRKRNRRQIFARCRRSHMQFVLTPLVQA